MHVRLGLLLVDHRDRAVRVADQSATDGTERQSVQCAHAAAADHHKPHVLGRIDEGGQRMGEQELGIHFARPAIAEHFVDDLARGGENPVALAVLRLARILHRLTVVGDARSMALGDRHQREGFVTHRSLTHRPPHRGVGELRAVYTDQDSGSIRGHCDSPPSRFP